MSVESCLTLSLNGCSFSAARFGHSRKKDASIRAIFISYRRNDAEGEAGRLFDDLVREFGDQSVFMDVAGIQPGRDFRKVIDESIATCGVLLAVIGVNWLDAKNESGERRLDDPSDFVRLETASALKRDIPVIPVLVRGSKMPRPDALPEDLRDLAYRNAVELTHARWSGDLQFLFKALRPLLNVSDNKDQQAETVAVSRGTPIREVSGEGAVAKAVLEGPASSPQVVRSGAPRPLKFVVGGAGILAVAGILAYVLSHSGTTIPDVRGYTLQDARVKLGAAGFPVGNTTTRDDPTKNPDVVIEQSPTPGTKVTKGASVELVLTPGLIQVPEVVGNSLDFAKGALEEQKLLVGDIRREKKPGVADNLVLYQSRAAGASVKSGTKIDLVIAEASKLRPPNPQPAAPAAKPTETPMAKVPDVVGMTLAEARTQLDVAGLILGNTTAQPGLNTSPGTVLGQSLHAGQRVKKGSAVDVTYSESTRLVEVPNVVGMTLTQAEIELRNHILSIASTRARAQEGVVSGTVLAQFPSQGERVQRGSGVALVVAESPRPNSSQLPNVAGTWELFERTANGKSLSVSPQHISIIQNGSEVTIFGRKLQIGSDGTASGQRYFAYDDRHTTRREVQTEDQAEYVEITILRQQGTVLTFEIDLRYTARSRLAGQPNVNVWKYRSVN